MEATTITSRRSNNDQVAGDAAYQFLAFVDQAVFDEGAIADGNVGAGLW
jgi:hypothetical protein